VTYGDQRALPKMSRARTEFDEKPYSTVYSKFDEQMSKFGGFRLKSYEVWFIEGVWLTTLHSAKHL
jgi:hypothetical protein